MVSVRMATYKKSTTKSIIDLIFAILLFSKSLIYCKIAKDFNYDLNS